MTFQPPGSAPSFSIPGVTVTTLSSPSLGARENAVWLVRLAPGRPGAPHRLSREETFVALVGKAEAFIDGVVHELRAGSALVVPAGASLAMANPGPQPFEALAILPVGAVVSSGNEPPFVPPWAV